jgi:uncharacterized membrane protein YqjE
MEHYKRELAFLLLLLAFTGGQVAYGLVTGMLHQRYAVVKRDKDPALFYALIILYLIFALFAIWWLTNLILIINHRNGLWMALI